MKHELCRINRMSCLRMLILLLLLKQKTFIIHSCLCSHDLQGFYTHERNIILTLHGWNILYGLGIYSLLVSLLKWSEQKFCSGFNFFTDMRARNLQTTDRIWEFFSLFCMILTLRFYSNFHEAQVGCDTPTYYVWELASGTVSGQSYYCI